MIKIRIFINKNESDVLSCNFMFIINLNEYLT